MRGIEQADNVIVRYPRRNSIAITLLLFVTALAFIALFNLVTVNPVSVQTSAYVTITGTPVCLPHKENASVTTLECAIGIKGDDGRYYALSDSSNELMQQDFSSRLKVRGILEQPESDSKYSIAGSITVKSYTKL